MRKVLNVGGNSRNIALPAIYQGWEQVLLDIDDFLYQSPAGPITVRDVLYGFGVEIERSGQDFYAHKTGFTQKSLVALLRNAGFSHVFAGSRNLEIAAFAFKAAPTAFAATLLKLPPAAAGG